MCFDKSCSTFKVHKLTEAGGDCHNQQRLKSSELTLLRKQTWLKDTGDIYWPLAWSPVTPGKPSLQRCTWVQLWLGRCPPCSIWIQPMNYSTQHNAGNKETVTQSRFHWPRLSLDLPVPSVKHSGFNRVGLLFELPWHGFSHMFISVDGSRALV